MPAVWSYHLIGREDLKTSSRLCDKGISSRSKREKRMKKIKLSRFSPHRASNAHKITCLAHPRYRCRHQSNPITPFDGAAHKYVECSLWSTLSQAGCTHQELIWEVVSQLFVASTLFLPCPTFPNHNCETAFEKIMILSRLCHISRRDHHRCIYRRNPGYH